MNDFKYLTEDSFYDYISSNDKPVLVYFWAAWCGPCKKLFPVLEKVKSIYSESVLFASVNIDECPNIRKQNSIMSIPSVFFYKDCEITAKEIGVKSQAVYISHLEHLVTKES